MKVIIINGIEYVPLEVKENPKNERINTMMNELKKTHFKYKNNGKS